MRMNSEAEEVMICEETNENENEEEHDGLEEEMGGLNVVERSNSRLLAVNKLIGFFVTKTMTAI
jgi:hypothetical protein